jgi:excisionase family DNA binding protein
MWLRGGYGHHARKLAAGTGRSDMPGARELVDTTAAAGYLAVHPNTLRRLVAEGHVRFYRVGRSVRFDVADLDRYLDSCAVEPWRRRRPTPR